MSFLYITEDGAVMTVNGGYYEVSYKDGMIHKIPMETLESVALFGNVSVTTPCTKKLLENGVPVSYFSKKGAYFGRLESTRHINIFRLKKQIELTENSNFSIAIAKRMISAKLNNQAVILRRYERGKITDIKNELFQINNSKKKIAESETVE